MQIDTDGLELGDVVEDKITGFTGTIVAFTQWLTGCARASVQAKVNAEGKVPDALGFDVTQLTILVAKGTQPVPVTTGGPRPEPQRG